MGNLRNLLNPIRIAKAFVMPMQNEMDSILRQMQQRGWPIHATDNDFFYNTYCNGQKYTIMFRFGERPSETVDFQDYHERSNSDQTKIIAILRSKPPPNYVENARQRGVVICHFRDISALDALRSPLITGNAAMPEVVNRKTIFFGNVLGAAPPGWNHAGKEALLAAISEVKPTTIRFGSAAMSRLPASLLPHQTIIEKSWTSDRIEGASVYVIPSLNVSHRFVPRINGEPITMRNALPGHYKLLHESIALAQQTSSPPPPQRLDISTAAFVCFTTKYREYGHFLIETLPKLLITRYLMNNTMSFPVIAPYNPPKWVDEYLGMLFREHELLRVNELTHDVWIHTGLVPTLLGNGARFDPIYSDFLEKFFVSQVCDGGPDRRLFISRNSFRKAKADDFRLLDNEAEIASLALRYGYEVVEPQQHDVFEQIAMFAGASRIIGESSSAIHNTVFSASRLKMLVLNHVNPIQTHICGLREQCIDYILPDDGTNRSWENLGKVPKNYTVSAAEVERWLKLAG